MIAALVFLTGLSLLTAGAWLIYEPAAYLVPGLALMAGAWFYERGRRVEA